MKILRESLSESELGYKKRASDTRVVIRFLCCVGRARRGTRGVWHGRVLLLQVVLGTLTFLWVLNQLRLVHANHRLDHWVSKSNWLHRVSIHFLGNKHLWLVWIPSRSIGSRWYKSGRRRGENTLRLIILLILIFEFSLRISLLSSKGASYTSTEWLAQLICLIFIGRSFFETREAATAFAQTPSQYLAGAYVNKKWRSGTSQSEGQSDRGNFLIFGKAVYYLFYASSECSIGALVVV